MGEFFFAAAALKTPTRNGHNAQGVNLTFHFSAHLAQLYMSNTYSRIPEEEPHEYE